MKKSLKNFYRRLRSRFVGHGVINFRGKGVVNFIDVGSAGNLPSPWKENAKRIKRLLSFEPRNIEGTRSNIVAVDTALWEKNCERNLYIYKGRGGSGSSLFEQNYEYVSENIAKLCSRGSKHLANTWFERSELDRTEMVTCRKLDDVLNEIDQQFTYHFLKIDAQGAEYEILRGGRKFLEESCLGLQLELFVLPLYKEIKLLQDVVYFLNKMSFELVKKFPAHGTFNSQHDCVFLKKGQQNKVTDTILKVYELKHWPH